ncbi:MAG: hypothetical protein M3163_01830 [Actinomycetota bacterium]|nr:hypothetical protein [Actinomycetota bacterium]
MSHRFCGVTERYDLRMKKRRVTLNLDEDVVAALESVAGQSMSAVANEALRQAVAAEAHRAALLRWLDELDAEFGPPSASDFDVAQRLLDEAEGRTSPGTAA